MKKLITILALAIAIPSMVHAQGTINFQTTTAAMLVKNGSSGAVANVGLYYGPVGTLDANLVLLGAITVSPLNGSINGGTRTTGVNVLGGANAVLQVRAWTGAFATYEAAIASGTGLAGVTPSFTVTTGNPGANPPTLAANLTGWTSPLQLVAVPEPSTIALGVIGAGSLLFLRRKK